jgi:hypothetical protein
MLSKVEAVARSFGSTTKLNCFDFSPSIVFAAQAEIYLVVESDLGVVINAVLLIEYSFLH